jgi:hypothetical protein
MLFTFQFVSSVKWLEDELELNFLHISVRCRGNGNEILLLDGELHFLLLWEVEMR